MNGHAAQLAAGNTADGYRAECSCGWTSCYASHRHTPLDEHAMHVRDEDECGAQWPGPAGLTLDCTQIGQHQVHRDGDEFSWIGPQPVITMGKRRIIPGAVKARMRAARQAGATIAAIAAEFGVPRSTAHQIVSEPREAL